MTTVATVSSPTDATSTDDASTRIERWLQVADRWSERFGDRFNPILVKETRQALKSRQFVVTFSVLLFAALAWTVVGSLSMMPQIYTRPSAPRMLIGYYIVLAVPMMLVVPLAAYRSLENEIDDGTLELLSITTLSPWQIVLGKLASAMLQLLLYFIALFPCVAYAYTLRGVDLPTVGIMIFTLLIVGIFLTVVALFFAPLARTRSGRIVTLLAVMAILLAAQTSVGGFIITMIQQGNRLSGDEAFFLVLLTIGLSVAAAHLLLTTTAAGLTPISENRSTAIRVSLLGLTAMAVGLSAMAYRIDLGGLSLLIPTSICVALCVLWLIAGSMMIGESAVITPRIRRELPSSFLSRATLTFLTPGPITGLVLSSAVGLVLVAAFDVWMRSVLGGNRFASYESRQLVWLGRTLWAAAAYSVGLLVLSTWLMRLIRVRNTPRAEVGFAALVAVMVLTALVPYSIGLHLADYRPYGYSAFQATNWFWTISEVANNSSQASRTAWVVAVISAVGLGMTVFAHPKLMFPRRIALPRRVIEERERERLRHQSPTPID